MISFTQKLTNSALRKAAEKISNILSALINTVIIILIFCKYFRNLLYKPVF